MNVGEVTQPIHSSTGRERAEGSLAWLALLFFGSGCAALIYEVVWFQLLQLVIGSSAVSLAVLLGTYMGGMCLGSLALPRLIAARYHPLRVYAWIELGIGVLGIVVLYGVGFIDRFYAAIAVSGPAGILMRALVAAMCLLAPTLLMGASLPAMARRVESTPSGVSWLGLFYGANTAGAVFGCLLAGFYILRVHDMAVATYIAAAINLAVALAAFGLAGAKTHASNNGKYQFVSTPRPPGFWPVCITIALSGACALGAEVVWTRLLSLMLGATVYTFSIILAVFLAGLGIGSGAGSLIARQTDRPRLALGVCQLLLAGAIAWTAYTLAHSLPYWPIDPRLSEDPWFNFEVDLMRSLWAVFPAACLWGASFPLALAAVASRESDPGRWTGEVYAANTVGAIVGAVGFSIVLVPWIGTQQSQRVLVALSAAAAMTALVRRVRPMQAAVTAAIAIPVGLALIWTVAPVPWVAVAYGRRMATSGNPGRLLYMGEGMNSSIVISQPENGKLYFHVSGKVEASTESYDMRLQRMLAHLPALIHHGPRSVLVVGFGAGVTAGTFVPYPEVNRIVICEIESLIPRIATFYFGFENQTVMRDPRTTMVYDDARHYILTTKEKFDIITSDPIHPWVKGTSTLYSKEYFELAKRHLNPGGVVTQWVPLYESDLDTVKSEIATFFQVFPNGTIWGNDVNGEGYDIVLLGTVEPPRIDVDEIESRLARPDHLGVAKSMRSVGFDSGVNALETYAGRGPDLRGWLERAQINQDINLRLQYLAGMGVNHNSAALIYSEMLSYRRFPEGLFTGSAQRIGQLRTTIGSGTRPQQAPE